MNNEKKIVGSVAAAWLLTTFMLASDYPTWPFDNALDIIPGYTEKMESVIIEGDYPYIEHRSQVSLNRMAFNIGARAYGTGLLDITDHVSNEELLLD